MISQPLVMLLADFVLSLLATWILFRFLKSNASIIQPKWRAGGAIAGFILIFGMSFSFSDSWLSKYIYTTQRFNVSGTVMLDKGYMHDGTTVEEMPPATHALSENDGNYTLQGIRYDARNITEVTVAFRREGFIPVKQTFVEGHFTIDYEKLRIIIRDTMRLKRIPPATLVSGVSVCQGQKAILFGEVLLVTQLDTIRLDKAPVELYALAISKPDHLLCDTYTDANGRYIIADIPFGSFFFKVYYGREEALLVASPAGYFQKGAVFRVDKETVRVGRMYVRVGG